MKRIAVCGGIGCGKSVVCRVLKALGYPVYDSDSEARGIMDSDPEIHRRLVSEIHALAVVDGKIDRRLIGSIVFADADKLHKLNGIVHSAVRAHLRKWFEAREAEGKAASFVETAILYQSRLDRMVDEVWEVESPMPLRVERVMKRNNLSEQEVESRIHAQEFVPERVHPSVRILINDERTPLLPQIHALL